MIETFLTWLIKWNRILHDRCEYCGGELWHWDTKKAYCEDCDEKQ